MASSSRNRSIPRSALAFAEALLPGSAHIRGADEETVRAALQMTEHAGPAAKQGWLAAIAALDLAAATFRGKRFSNLDAQAQDELLARWETDPVFRNPLFLASFPLKLAHFDTEDVYESLGRKFNVVTNLEQPRWLSRITRTDDLEDAELECEVVVVGTGAGGAVVGKELVERGVAVIFLEEGKHLQRDAFDGRSTRAHETLYRPAISVGNATMPVFMGRLVGGSTAINTGTSIRTPDFVLERWCETIGTDEFAPSRMRPLFERVETIAEVEPARREVVGPMADVVQRGARKLGWSHAFMPRNAPGCDGDGFCDFGCRTDARRSTNLSYVPPALEMGAMLVTEARVDSITRENGVACGVEAVSPEGKRIRVRAKAVILAAGAVPTPLLLMRQGLCEESGELGRNLTLHPSAVFSAQFDDEIQGAHYVPQGMMIDEFLREGILLASANPDVNYSPITFNGTGSRLMNVMESIGNIGAFSILIADHGYGQVRFGLGSTGVITYNLAGEDCVRLKRAMDLCLELSRAAGARRFIPGVRSAGILHTDAEVDQFRASTIAAADFPLVSYHPLGTCKMGKDPKTSVVDTDHCTHDVPNLFVVDGSTVQGPLGVNPQITIMAMATRAAARIHERVFA